MNPVRVIEGQEAKLARALHGIVYDSVHDEIIAPNPFAEAILFFRGDTSRGQGPIRIIQGPHTQLDGGPDWNTPDSVAYDPVYEEVYTRLRRGWGEDATPAILAFPRTANGDVAPVRVLRGPKTMMSDPYRIAVDGKNNMLVIANRDPAGFLIFNRDDSGDVAPKAIISGPNTGIFGPPQQFQMDPERRQFIAAIPGPRGDDGAFLKTGFVGVWNYTDNGDVAPKAVIRGPKTELTAPWGLDINPKEKEVYVTDFIRNRLFTYVAPHIFED